MPASESITCFTFTTLVGCFVPSGINKTHAMRGTKMPKFQSSVVIF